MLTSRALSPTDMDWTESAEEHGGDLAAVRAAYPDAPLPWIDLSTGINPWPYPIGRIPPAAWQGLPSAGDERAVREAAAAYYGVPASDAIVLAPGSQALIQWLPRLRGRSRVTVLGPTYGEHVRSWAAAGHDVATVTSLDAVGRDIDVVVVTRPNNPDGRMVGMAALEDAASRLQRRGGWLVIDEAFADAAGLPSVVAALRSDAVIGLRSFGKFFGLAGGRLGAALAAPSLCGVLRQALGPWSVAGPVLAVAGRAFRDREWIARTRARLQRGAARLDRRAARAGLHLVGGTSLFRLYETPRAASLFAALAACGIYVRRFAAHPDWLRVGLLPNGEAERRFARGLDAGAPGSEKQPP